MKDLAIMLYPKIVYFIVGYLANDSISYMKRIAYQQ